VKKNLLSNFNDRQNRKIKWQEIKRSAGVDIIHSINKTFVLCIRFMAFIMIKEWPAHNIYSEDNNNLSSSHNFHLQEFQIVQMQIPSAKMRKELKNNKFIWHRSITKLIYALPTHQKLSLTNLNRNHSKVRNFQILQMLCYLILNIEYCILLF